MPEPVRVTAKDLLRGARRLLPRLPRALFFAGDVLGADRAGNAVALFERNARWFRGRPALVCGRRRWTWDTLNADANRFAGALRGAGVGAGDVVALLLDNRAEAILLVLAVAKLGAVAAPIPHGLRGEPLSATLRAAGAGWAVLGSERAADGEVVYAALPQRVLGVADVGVEPGDRDLSVLATSESAGNPPAPRDPDGTFFAIFTSGTTGLPKASRMTHRRWAKASATYGHLLLTLTPDDAIYVALPLFHNMALTVALSAAVATGARIVLRRRFSASAFWDDCREHHITCFPYIGELPRFLLAQPPSPRDRDHRVTQMVGVGLREATWRAFTERFSVPHVIEHYGASESNTLFVNVIDVPGSVGFCPSPHRLVEWDADEDAPLRDGAGVPLDAPPGEAGMLLTKINDRFRYDGYADPAASERRLLRSLYESDDCWFVTGDLLRAAGWGHYVFVDRAGDTWRWRGENVSAQQVEDVARTTPFPLADCAAYGVSVPGAEGRAGMLAIVSEPPDDAAIDVLLDGIAAALLPAAVPLFVRRVPDLPRTETMKTQKGGLRADGWDVADVWVRLPGRRAERLGDSLRRAIREGNAGL